MSDLQIKNYLEYCQCQKRLDKKTINYPGASTQVLCSAPTSPLTALAFYTCICKCKSGV